MTRNKRKAQKNHSACGHIESGKLINVLKPCLIAQELYKPIDAKSPPAKNIHPLRKSSICTLLVF